MQLDSVKVCLFSEDDIFLSMVSTYIYIQLAWAVIALKLLKLKISLIFILETSLTT